MTQQKNRVIIDGNELVLGRMGSHIAKRLLLGEEITIVNCKDVILLGKKNYVLERYQKKRKERVMKKGPYFHRSPSKIVKRSLRNMVPYKSQRGKEALSRLTCYNSVPSTLKSQNKESIDSAKINYESAFYYTTVGEISKLLGYKS